jgi:hypothetical protein
MGRFSRGIGTDADGFGDGRDGEWIDEWLQRVYAERAMYGNCSGRSGAVPAGHDVVVGKARGLLRERRLEGTDLGRGQGGGAAGGFEEELSTRGWQECFSFPMG